MCQNFIRIKTKTDVLKVSKQLQLNTAETAVYNGIEEALRVIITREIKPKKQDRHLI